LRLANLDNDIVDRLSRYEAAIWRQLAPKLHRSRNEALWWNKIGMDLILA